MDEQDLEQFQKYVQDFSRVAGDRKTSQGLANLVMIQKELGGQRLSPVRLDDDAVYTTKKGGSLGLVRNMKVSLDGASDDTFMPLIQGLRRSTLNVRLRNSIIDVVEPLADVLYAQQLEQMTHSTELHREDVIYYRQMVHAIDNLGKKNQQSFLDSVLVGYRRFIRNPIWTTLSFAITSLDKLIARPLIGILTGWKKKSDTDRIIDAIQQQTKYMRTGKIDSGGFGSQFAEKGVFGVIGKSLGDSLKAVFGMGSTSPQSPQERSNLLIGEVLAANQATNEYLDSIEVINRSNLAVTKMVEGTTLHLQKNAVSLAENILQGIAETNNHLNMMVEVQRNQFGHLQMYGNEMLHLTSEGTDAEKDIKDINTLTNKIHRDHYEEFEHEKMEIYKKQLKEAEEHNKREKRRTLFSALKSAIPGVLGILGIGLLSGGYWYTVPDKAKEVIGGAVSWGLGKLLDWEHLGTALGVGLMLSPVGWWVRSIGASVALISSLHNWLQSKFGTSESDVQSERDARINPTLGLGGQTRMNELEFRSSDFSNLVMTKDPRVLELQKRADELGRQIHLGTAAENVFKLEELNRLNDQIRKLNKGAKGGVPGMINRDALHSALRVGGAFGRRDTSSLSSGGMGFVAEKEGFRENAYQDEAGVWTIGYGTTQMDGRKVRQGDKISEEKALELFKNDYNKHREAVSNLVSVPLDKNQLDALTSLSYNIGIGAFKDSTLLKKINSGDFEGAASEFSRWNKVTVDGEKVPSGGLTSRRREEANMFRGGNSISASTTPSGARIPQASIDGARPSASLGNGNQDEKILLSGISDGIHQLVALMSSREDQVSVPSDRGTSFAAFGA